MIPTELLTMGVSVIGGGALKIMGAMAKAKADAHKRMIEKIGVQTKAYEAKASAGTEGFRFTRRIIALSVIGAVIVLPKLAAVVAPELSVTYGWTTSSEGLFWGLFGGEDQKLIWHTVNGLIITPLDNHIAMAIAGLYFGASIAGEK